MVSPADYLARIKALEVTDPKIQAELSAAKRYEPPKYEAINPTQDRDDSAAFHPTPSPKS